MGTVVEILCGASSLGSVFAALSLSVAAFFSWALLFRGLLVALCAVKRLLWSDDVKCCANAVSWAPDAVLRP